MGCGTETKNILLTICLSVVIAVVAFLAGTRHVSSPSPAWSDNHGKSLVYLPYEETMTPRGTEAAQDMLHYLVDRDLESVHKALALYKEIIPLEQIGGDYTALQWFGDYFVASPPDQALALQNGDAEVFFRFFSRDDFALLKIYLMCTYPDINLEPFLSRGADSDGSLPIPSTPEVVHMPFANDLLPPLNGPLGPSPEGPVAPSSGPSSLLPKGPFAPPSSGPSSLLPKGPFAPPSSGPVGPLPKGPVAPLSSGPAGPAVGGPLSPVSAVTVCPYDPKEIQFLEDLLLFGNPRRSAWENTDEIIKHIGLTKGSVIADIGAGPGYHCLKFSRIVGDTGMVYAVETNGWQLAYLDQMVKKEKLKNIRPVLSLPTDVSLSEKSVDRVFMCSLYHIIYTFDDELERTSFINSIKRALRDDGRLIIVDNDVAADLPYHGPRIAKELIIEQLRYYGFTLMEVHQTSPQRFLLVFRKG